MQRFKSFLHEGKNTPHAIWVVGGAASGKSTVAEKAIVSDLKFTLIDVDKPFEEMLKQFNLSPDIKKSTPEQLEKSRARKKKIVYGSYSTVWVITMRIQISILKNMALLILNATKLIALPLRSVRRILKARQNISLQLHKLGMHNL